MTERIEIGKLIVNVELDILINLSI